MVWLMLLLLSVSLPNPSVTPGKAALFDQATVCSTKWGKDARHVTEAMKREVASAYGLRRGSIVGYGRGPCCEFDHLISRELGGSDDVLNLWPQPWAEAKQKDALENYLHREVCAGRMTLSDAQRAIASDWRAAWEGMRR